MSDHSSSLTQRVRRLLGTGSLVNRGDEPDGVDVARNHTPPPPAAPAAQHHHAGSHQARRPDTGVLFESQIARLSTVLRELHAIDRAREAELRHLRERLAIAEAMAQVQMAERLTPAVAQLDAMICEAARMLQPAPEPPPSATLFERMCARSAGITDQTSRVALVAWASALLDLRTQLSAILDS